ncbi:DUF5000 domain-containing lipoprotein [Flavihumibacter petaseus]|uniref:DUF4959 domain-containing protein n=1 Tax=Flavihumibacter petaseus NBRC 106054 TaxID=1220578 RepID=A0A0E9N4R2_9BACT|nr:DUF5000 domain-containing lipoprotein [Flavihumibacter petaseus]GAO44661.1 hypothetical protein FPE01S_03_07000 [Flavihumibacter petaseus NBRC 106054]
MLSNRILLCCWLVSLTILSCDKKADYNSPPSTDPTKPLPVTNVQSVAVNGGAEISYDLPKSDNILYVQADYKINQSVSRQTKASYYDNKLVVDGFNEEQDYQVTLTVISRAEVKSDPVTVTVHPLKPVYRLVRETITALPDFGGVFVSGTNSRKKDVGVIVMTKDQNGDWQVADQQFSAFENIKFSVRGYAAEPRDFAIFTTDKWNNVSDTLFTTLTPLYEYQLDKAKFQPYPLPTDQASDWGWEVNYLWDNDGITEGSGFHTAVGGGMPQHFTFDLGVSSQLSRYKIWERTGTYTYYHGNPKRWRIWGATNPNPDGSFDGWTLLGEFECYPKPSGLPGPSFTPEDELFAQAGFEYNFPVGLPAVRYLRFETLETWSGSSFMHMMELTFWGN